MGEGAGAARRHNFRTFAAAESTIAMPARPALTLARKGAYYRRDATGTRLMTDSITIDRPANPANKPPVRKHDEAGLDLVSGYKLAAHLGISRQGVDALAAQGVLTRRSDGLFGQTASRLAYLKHLKAERRGSTGTAAQAEYAKQKARLLELRIAKQERSLMLVTDHDAVIDELCGIVLTKLGGWPARIGGTDLDVRRRAEAVLRELRTEIAETCLRLADECNEPDRS
jgi:hypothetical protein